MMTTALQMKPVNDTTPAPVTRHRGEHANSSLTSAQIAAFIRSDLKDAMKAGGLPTMKVSVTARSYSMGQSVTVRIVTVPFAILNPDRVREVAADRFGDSDLPRLTPRASQILARIEAIMAEYTRSDTDSHSDLYNTNCHMDVKFDHDTMESERTAILASK